jgi:predicted GNAT family N-acyltransferase
MSSFVFGEGVLKDFANWSMENMVITAVTSAAPQYQQVWQLREDVLRKPLGLSLKNEDLARDHTDTIFIAEDSNGVIACLMLQHQDGGKIKFRQMAVAPGWQGKGIGRMIMKAAEQWSAEKGYNAITLHARKTAVGFYEGLGYRITGSEFAEVGIPHYAMAKSLGTFNSVAG